MNDKSDSGETKANPRSDLTRREFVNISMASLAGATLGFVSSRPSLAENIEASFPYSTSTVMYKGCGLEEAIAEIANAGYQAVDIWEVHGHIDWIEKNGSEKLRGLLEKHKLKLYAFSIYFTPGPKRLNRLELLKDCGGQVAVLGGGGGKTVADAAARLKPLVEKAEALGLKVAGENHGNTVLDSIASLREFAALAKSPALGVALAPYHVMGRKESVADAVEAVGDKLFYFYAWQRAPGLRELPGDGTLDFAPVVKALHKVKYQYYLNVFTHAHAPKEKMTQSIIKSREYLEELVAAARS